MQPGKRALAAFQKWYDDLPRPKSAAGAPAKGSIAVGVVILDRLKSSFDLSLDAHLSPGGAQIQGLSGPAVKNILASHGETRRFTDQGGRTNRGSPTIARNLLQTLAEARLDSIAEAERVALLHQMQSILVDRVREFHNRERLMPLYDPAKTMRQFVADLLALAEETGKRGPVAQYLIGAKLCVRLPDEEVRNNSYAAADDPAGDRGDFDPDNANQK